MGGRYHVRKDGASGFPRGGPDRVSAVFVAKNMLFRASLKRLRNRAVLPVAGARSVHGGLDVVPLGLA
jgi:hypothetical protein